MTQPQDPSGHQSPPQQQFYPDVKPLPKGWQQPINQPPVNQQPQMPPPGYYQQPQQYNPNAYYVPVPHPQAVKQWPWWGTALLFIGIFGAIIYFGSKANINSGVGTTNEQQQQQVVATAGPTQRVAQAAATVAPTLKLGRIGETIALNGYTITVNGVDKSENFDPSSSYGKVKDGFIFVAVDVTVGSNKAKDVSSNALFSALKDSDGFKYDQPFSGYKKPLLPGENDIPAGDKVRGWVTFEVKKSAAGFIFEYGQMFENEKIRVALS